MEDVIDRYYTALVTDPRHAYQFFLQYLNSFKKEEKREE